MDYLYFVFAILIFLAVVLLIEGAYLAWNSTRGPEAQRLNMRLRAMAAGENAKTVAIAKKRTLSDNPRLHRLLAALPKVHVLDRLLVQSGKNWSVAGFASASLAAGVVAWALTAFFALPLPLQLVAAGAAMSLPLQVVLRARIKRLDQLENQLPDALDLMSRALRAGHAFPTALKMVGDEMKNPIAGEFATVFDEVNFGVAMPDALMSMANRVPSTDLRYFVVAVLIQRETGGNLSELLGSISTIIRDRIKLLGQVRVLSAEGRMSAWVLGLLPFGAGALIQLSSPDFLAVLFTDPGGRKMVGVSLGMMVFGIFVMRRIVKIRV